MAKDSPETIYLKDYIVPGYSVDSVDLIFDLAEEHSTVTSTLLLKTNTEKAEPLPALVLFGENLELQSISMDGVSLTPDQYRLTGTELHIQPVRTEFSLEIVTRLYPQKNAALEGLYKSGDMFCTQCEAEGFRRISYYLDRPDIMAKFTTTILADKTRYPVLLSNGNPIDQGMLDNHRHWVQWHDPFRKPSYLFALVAGNLKCREDHYETMSGKTVDLHLYVEPENINKCDHAMASLKKAMQWDEQVFGLEYDLDIYMIVAVSDFNMGAMENKGLNIFNTAYVLAQPETATDNDYLGIEGVIGHEYFHNWTGNRVTCRDWFQLSLKEGLTVFRDQEFSADMGLRAVKRIDDVRILRGHQFPEDSGPMAHPVRPDSYIEINNFYTMTVYNKGAEVIRMYQTLLGKDGFRQGMDLYFQRHDGQAVTTDDFCAAMADANHYDLSRFRRWYEQAGTPVITVTDEYDPESRRYTLYLSQSCADTPGQSNKKPFLIPFAVGLLGSRGQDLEIKIENDSGDTAYTRVLKFDEQEMHFSFCDVAEKPVPSLLRQFSAPVIVKYDYSNAELAFLWANDSDDFNRWEAGQHLLTRFLLDRVNRPRSGAMIVDPLILDAIKGVLGDKALNTAMCAELLQLPSEAWLGEQMPQIDVIGIHTARQQLRCAIARECEAELQLSYHRLHDDKPYRFSTDAIGARRLKNSCLSYLMELGHEDMQQLCLRQYKESDNMTDVLAALAALINHDNPNRDEVLTDFYMKWRHEPLVMDKWFAMQAACRLPGTLDTVKELLDHEAFNIKNPNKVRALIGTFCRQNLSQFHDAGGQGYRFLTDRILELDPVNPQIAARLVAIFSQWRRYDPARQQAMQDELQRIVGTRGLSPDCYEIVSKSLAQGVPH